MAKRIFIYAILVFFFICFFVLYTDLLSLILLVIIITYPIAMLALLFIVKHKSNIKVSAHSMVCSKNSDISIKVTIENQSYFPVPNAIINISYKNNFEDISDKLTAVVPIQAQNRQEVNFKLTSKYCGKIEVKLDNIAIKDYLKLFSIKIIPVQSAVNIVVTPDCHPIDSYLSNNFYENQDSDLFSKTKSGDDPSEVFNINEYREGDKINKIHWKLSAKANYPMVKEYSRPITNNTVLIFDFYCHKSDETIVVLDTLVETLLSVSTFLIENDGIHTVVWYNQLTDKLEIDVISNEDDIFRLIGDIFNINPYFTNPHALIKYANYESTYHFAHAIHVTAYSNSDSMQIFSSVENCLKKTLILVEDDSDISTVSKCADIDTLNVKLGKVKQCLADFVI